MTGHLTFESPNIGTKDFICIPDVSRSDRTIGNHVSIGHRNEIPVGGLPNHCVHTSNENRLCVFVVGVAGTIFHHSTYQHFSGVVVMAVVMIVVMVVVMVVVVVIHVG